MTRRARLFVHPPVWIEELLPLTKETRGRGGVMGNARGKTWFLGRRLGENGTLVTEVSISDKSSWPGEDFA